MPVCYVEQQRGVYSALMDEAVKSVKDIAVLAASELKLAEELIQLHKPLKTITALMSSETFPFCVNDPPTEENVTQIYGTKT